MNYTFFYLSLIATPIIFLICLFYRRLTLSHIIIGIASIAYSLAYDILFGIHFKLYYYIDVQTSYLYLMLSAIFIYSLLNIIYILFLPSRTKTILIYTGIWIAVMLVFEFASIYFGTIVFTGWKPIPWSVVTYLITYTWIYFFFRLLRKRITEIKK